jgi:nitrite reductase (NADH) small subunit
MDKTFIVNLGSIDQIPIGQSRCFIVNNEEAAVIRPRSGGLFALENQCPHRRGPLSEGVVGGDKIVCPLHGHKFDLATGKGSEAHECVRVFKVWELNGKIMMEYVSVKQGDPHPCLPVS